MSSQEWEHVLQSLYKKLAFPKKHKPEVFFLSLFLASFEVQVRFLQKDDTHGQIGNFHHRGLTIRKRRLSVLLQWQFLWRFH